MKTPALSSPLDYGSLAFAGFGGLILVYLAIACFNVYFHPLSKFPGPRLAACSGWWLVYHELIRGGSLAHILSALHDRYGKAVFLQAYFCFAC